MTAEPKKKREPKSMLQRIQAHEAARDHCLQRVAEWNEKAERHERIAAKLKADAAEAAGVDA